VSLDTGTGGIDYEGQPEGHCRFDTGAGGITLRLPADLEMELDLDTGAGSIDLGGFAVDGHVRRGEVKGRLGDGSQGSITADTGTGGIDLVRR
jgi:hypothetical protein